MFLVNYLGYLEVTSSFRTSVKCD